MCVPWVKTQNCEKPIAGLENGEAVVEQACAWRGRGLGASGWGTVWPALKVVIISLDCVPGQKGRGGSQGLSAVDRHGKCCLGKRLVQDWGRTGWERRLQAEPSESRNWSGWKARWTEEMVVPRSCVLFIRNKNYPRTIMPLCVLKVNSLLVPSFHCKVEVPSWMWDLSPLEGCPSLARACAQRLSPVWLFVTPWTTCSHQAPLSRGFSRQKYWRELPFPSPGDLSHPGTEPKSLTSLI